MSIAHNQTTSAGPGFPVLLPGPAEVLAEIDARSGTPTDLLLVGLLRRDDSRPLSPSTLTSVTAALAWCIRGEDWLGRSGSAEFAVLLEAGAAEVVAERLVPAVTTAAGGALSAAAGVATVQSGLAATEVLRRAMLSLNTARSLGAGTTIRYAGTR